MRDCDFFTFIPSWRRLIAPEVLFVDMEQTKEVRYAETGHVLFKVTRNVLPRHF